MNIFKSFTMTWWQGSLFKISMIFGGVAIGAYWPQIFTPFLVPLIIIAIVCGVYLSYVWWKQ